MSERLITTTSNEGVQTLGSAAQRSYELVTTTLLARLGPDMAALFAEPVTTSQGAAIEWYTSQPGLPVRLADLPDAEAAAVRAQFDAQVARIAALADELAAQRSEQGFWLADALRNATATPDAQALWALRAADGRLAPIVVNWGRVADTTGPVRGVLTALATRPVRALPAAAAPPPPPVAQSAALPGAAVPETAAMGGTLWPWLLALGWLVLALLITLILWLMIAPCGVLPVSVRHCSASAAAAALPADALLGAEIAQLEARLGNQQRQCLAARPTLPAAPAGDRADLDRRLIERGAASGRELTFTLIWQGPDDLDLSVTCPSGELISFRNPVGDCGGALDIDANFPVERAVPDPVENIGFAQATPGRYRIGVLNSADRPPTAPQPFSVVVRQVDHPEQVYAGEVAAARSQWTTEIEIAP